MSEEYFYGTGRRKTSVARVRLYPGAGGNVVVNGKPLDEVLNRPVHRMAVLKPLAVTETQGKFNVEVRVTGGGVTGWADAIAHGMARALCAADIAWRPALKKQGLLTRDARMKERKKYGLKRARKAPQYTKR